MALYTRCPVWPSGTIPLGHQSQARQGYPLCLPLNCGLVVIAIGTLVGGLGCQASWLQAQPRLLWVYEVYLALLHEVVNLVFRCAKLEICT